jgi:asparagine synthase (glutamine-hydrolysing)
MKPFLPSEVLNKRKLGFNPPVGAWLNGELRNLPQVLLSDERVRARGLFRPGAIACMLEDHASRRPDFSLKIWALMMLELWFSMYVDSRSVESVQE